MNLLYNALEHSSALPVVPDCSFNLWLETLSRVDIWPCGQQRQASHWTCTASSASSTVEPPGTWSCFLFNWWRIFWCSLVRIKSQLSSSPSGVWPGKSISKTWLILYSSPKGRNVKWTFARGAWWPSRKGKEGMNFDSSVRNNGCTVLHMYTGTSFKRPALSLPLQCTHKIKTL